ncbi:MAG: glycosyltransferase [Cyanophyceae cyanobacterium]
MTHFGILCMAGTGHINTMFPLGQELQRRGHRVTVLSASEVPMKAEAGFNFCSVYSETIGRRKQPSKTNKSSNLASLQQTLQRFALIAETRLQTAPAIIRKQGIEALLIDVSVFEGGTIAEYLKLPYVTVCCILPFYQDLAIPPIFTTWQYHPGWWAKLRNQVAYSLLNRLAKPTWKVISRYRQRWQLPAYRHPNDVFSDLAIITRHVKEFEFPRQLPPHFHFTGPFHHSTQRQPVPFPDEQLNGQPLIYASMGTVQNHFRAIFYTIAAACADLDVQLIISLGGRLDPEALPDLPSNPLVVKYAPQLALLQKASLAITHAGLNTALESLSYGVPMVAIPITDDQPGVAARIAWTGTGEVVTPSRLDVTTLRAAIAQGLTGSHKQNVIRLQKVIHQTRGVVHACDIAEQAVLTRKPVMN